MNKARKPLDKKSFAAALALPATLSLLLAANYAPLSFAKGPSGAAGASAAASAPETESTITAAEDTAAKVEREREEKATKEAQALQHYQISEFYFHKWNLPLAANELDQTIHFWPDLKIAHRNLALVSLYSGQPLRALAEFMVVVNLGDPIPLNAKEVAALNEKSTKLHYRRAIEMEKKQLWNDAIAECEWALLYSPNNAAVNHSLAFAYANLGQFEKAEEQYTTTFALDPADGYAHADFANLLADNGKEDTAIHQMTEAVKLEPKSAALHVDLGWLSEKKGDMESARKEFQTAVNLSPNHAALWSHLGKILEREGKSKEAVEAYKKALSIDPAEDDAKQRLAKLEAPAQS